MNVNLYFDREDSVIYSLWNWEKGSYQIPPKYTKMYIFFFKTETLYHRHRQSSGVDFTFDYLFYCQQYRNAYVLEPSGFLLGFFSISKIF